MSDNKQRPLLVANASCRSDKKSARSGSLLFGLARGYLWVGGGGGVTAAAVAAATYTTASASAAIKVAALAAQRTFWFVR